MQKWKKLGCIFNQTAYAAVPVAYFIDDDVIRIFFSNRDELGRSFPMRIDFNLKYNKVFNLSKINISFGKLGYFDENGIMPTSLLLKDGKLYVYYIGWNLAKTVPFRNAIGLLVSNDNGEIFEKYSEGPLLDRNIYDKCFVASCDVLNDNNGIYRIYYLSCDDWKYIENKLVHFYNIKYAESTDGIYWSPKGLVAINFSSEKEYAISVPRVKKEKNLYKMWYSYRGSKYADNYRIGYAESKNAIDWVRMDNLVSLDVSPSGWDSEMICYPYVFDHNGNRYMLYNGNGYGKTGFGLAVLEQD